MTLSTRGRQLLQMLVRDAIHLATVNPQSHARHSTSKESCHAILFHHRTGSAQMGCAKVAPLLNVHFHFQTVLPFNPLLQHPSWASWLPHLKSARTCTGNASTVPPCAKPVVHASSRQLCGCHNSDEPVRTLTTSARNIQCWFSSLLRNLTSCCKLNWVELNPSQLK